jgi:hypothetical protein
MFIALYSELFSDLKRRVIVLTGTRCTYFELKTTHKTFCMVIYAAIHCYISYKLAYNSLNTECLVDIIIFIMKLSLCIIDTGNCVPGKRENHDESHTRGGNLKWHTKFLWRPGLGQPWNEWCVVPVLIVF